MQPGQWSPSTRIAFRFASCYWILYCLPSTGRTSVLGLIPGLGTAARRLWQAIVPWLGIHVFHLSGPVVTYRPTGSYTLVATLFSYGFSKIFPLQFPYPALGRLTETFGDFSPMGVLWSFMGAWPAYMMFAGSAEVLGGLLLAFRCTTTLGALVTAGTMLNVVALNFCYDVPVKLYSSNLLLMAVFLAAPDVPALARLLILRQPAEPKAPSGPKFDERPPGA